MIFGVTFPNFSGVWGDFHLILQGRITGLKARLSDAASGVSEETHHISLACGLVEACLQQEPEDRRVALSLLYIRKITVEVVFDI
jgi:hypothetical protein